MSSAPADLASCAEIYAASRYPAAGRVAESLLRAVGLPELVAPSLPDFEAQAIALAGEPQTLKALRDKLAANRVATPLFDMPPGSRLYPDVGPPQRRRAAAKLQCQLNVLRMLKLKVGLA